MTNGRPTAVKDYLRAAALLSLWSVKTPSRFLSVNQMPKPTLSTSTPLARVYGDGDGGGSEASTVIITIMGISSGGGGVIVIRISIGGHSFFSAFRVPPPRPTLSAAQYRCVAQ